jgi:DNA-binding CsgD family transcriptional regulator
MHDLELHNTILALYQGCRDVPAQEFKKWAMEISCSAVAFDSGIWGTPDVVSDDFSSVYLFRQPAEMIENYDRNVHLSGDPLGQAALAHPHQTVLFNNMPAFGQDASYRQVAEHTRRYGITHALATYHVTPVTKIATGIAFYRADPKAPFTEADRQTKELLVPHLIEAMRINLFSFLHGSQFGKIHPGSALAICDPTGMLYETTPRFPVVLHDVWTKWAGQRLPLPFDRLEGAKALRWSLDGLEFRASPCRDMFLVSVVKATRLDALSARQRQVAELLAKGKQYKDIARELSISPSTVTKHVNQIHDRLQISGREELIGLFSETNALSSET